MNIQRIEPKRRHFEIPGVAIGHRTGASGSGKTTIASRIA
jgi:uridine kinase